jgi:hypothetical protein
LFTADSATAQVRQKQFPCCRSVGCRRSAMSSPIVGGSLFVFGNEKVSLFVHMSIQTHPADAIVAVPFAGLASRWL